MPAVNFMEGYFLILSPDASGRIEKSDSPACRQFVRKVLQWNSFPTMPISNSIAENAPVD